MKTYVTLFVIFALFVGIAFWANMYFIVSGFGLAVFMLLTVGFTYCFFPRWLKCFLMWAPMAFLLDFGLSWGLTYGMGYSITGFTAGIIFGLILSMAMKFERARLFNTWSGG